MKLLVILFLLIKHVLCAYKFKFHGIKCNSNQKWNYNKYWCKCKNPRKHLSGRKYIWNPSTCTCTNGKYSESVIVNQVIGSTKTVPTKTAPTKTNPTKNTNTRNFIEKRKPLK